MVIFGLAPLVTFSLSNKISFSNAITRLIGPSDWNYDCLVSTALPNR